MIFLIALAAAVIFVILCGKSLRKHPGAYYAAAATIMAVCAVCAYSGITAAFPLWFSSWIWPLMARGAFGTALFVIVMFTGALKNGSKAMFTLMPVRGELSIIASILTLGHNVIYGKTYFKAFFTDASVLSGAQLAACITSIVMIAIMIPLFITSFKTVRRKMKAKSWKKLQRLAYGFYALIYVHVMLLSVPMYMRGIGSYLINIAAYTVVFGVYAVMRVRKAYMKKAKISAAATAGTGRAA